MRIHVLSALPAAGREAQRPMAKAGNSGSGWHTTRRPRTAGATQRSATAAASGMATARGGGTLASAASAGGRDVSEATSLSGFFSIVWNLKRGFLTETGFD
jgi:hypothetical protein